MFTSYFAASHPNPVAICRYTPRGWRRPHYPLLAPTAGILSAYKNKLINEEKYRLMFIEQVLSPLDPRQIHDELVELYGGGCALICYEKPAEFCHRRIVAEWFHTTIGVVLKEYVPPPLKLVF